MNIGIVGAGILGRLLAMMLINKGCKVTLFDQDNDSGQSNCSMAAAGLLAPVSELEKSEPLIYELGMEAMEVHWPEVLNKIGKNIYFKKAGSIVVSHPTEQAELQHFISIINAKIGNLISKPEIKNCYKKINQPEITNLEPELTKFTSGYYLLGESQLDNQALMNGLKEYLQENGVIWRFNSYVNNIINNTIIIHSISEKFDIVFDCRGMGAKHIFKNLHAVRGELIWLHAPEVNFQRPIRLLHPRYHLYIVPRPQQRYIIGSSEIYSDDYSAISVRSTLELLTAAYYLHPGFAEARIEKTVSHCRPTLSDHLPKIKWMNDAVALNGLYRHGFLIAPTLVIEISRWMDKGISGIKFPQLWEVT